MRFVKTTLFKILLALCLLSAASSKPLVVAHRGGRNIGSENRLSTITKAIELGVDAIEVDIHQSRDGHLIVAHDLNLDRCFGVAGQINLMTVDELRAIGVPTLQEVAQLVDGRCRLVIEIKHPKDGTRHVGIEKNLAELLSSQSLVESSLVISFYADSIRAFHAFAPKVDAGFLFSTFPRDLVTVKEELGVSYLGPRHSIVTKSFIEQAHRLGLKVNPWTVNGLDGLRRFIGMGCDAITTDDPHLLLGILSPKWFMSQTF